MTEHPSVARMWDEYCALLGDEAATVRARSYEAWHFEVTEAAANRLAELVVSGQKRATASLLWTFEAEGAAPPRAGDHSIITDWTGVARCVIRTTQTEVVPFAAVTADFARREGEGDLSLAYWQRVHASFFSHECARIGRQFDDQVPVLCEDFAVVYPR